MQQQQQTAGSSSVFKRSVFDAHRKRDSSNIYAQNPLHTFPRNFPVHAANLLWTCYGETGVMEFDLYSL